MKFAHVANALLCQPWAIRTEMYAQMYRIFQDHVSADKPEFDAAKVRIWGEEVEYDSPEEYAVIDGIAVVQVHGILGRRMSAFVKACMGGCDYDDVITAIDQIEEDHRILGAVIDFDTPGGNVTGLPEAAKRIAAASKPIVGYTEIMSASAGYYLMSGCDAVYASESSEVGCIGTVCSVLDVSKAYEEAGYKRELFASGKYKGMAWPGTSLTEEQRELLQNDVDTLAAQFKGWVRENRGDVPDDVMEGQCLRSAGCLDCNLIDAVGDLNDAMNEVRELAANMRGA